MSIGDILIILGCLAGGYWIVNSVMGPGVDITRKKPPEPPAGDAPGAMPPDRIAPPEWARTSSPKRLPDPRHTDWHLLLDVPRTATRADIETAYKRQLNKALAAGDMQQQERLRVAREAALAQLSKSG